LSRLGKTPLPLPEGVKVSVEGVEIKAQGPKGSLSAKLVDGITVSVGDGGVLVSRRDDSRPQRASQGLIRSLVANMLTGVSEGFTKTLEMTGVGYRADAKGQEVHLSLGFSHPIVYTLPEGISVKTDNQNVITDFGDR